MRLQSKLAMLVGTMVLGMFPAVAFGTPGFCQEESKKHVAGQRRRPYSVCVSGAKKLLKQQAGG